MNHFDSLPKRVRLVGTSVAVDWITVTAKSADSRRYMWDEQTETRLELFEEGSDFRPWKFCGYDGIASTHFRWGTRIDSDIVMLSGPAAAAYWYRFGILASNCSRLDLAVTVETGRCYAALLRHYYDEWRRIEGPRNKTVTLLNNSDGGKTLYVGSRASREFGRVYDKGAEVGDPLKMHRLWRYEVELKEQASRVALAALVSAYQQNDFPQVIQPTVYQWFDKRSIPPIFEKRGEALTLEMEANVTNDEVSLHWISTQVRPTVKRLRDKGKLDELLVALGLDN